MPSGPAPRAERDRLGLRPAAGVEAHLNRTYRKLGIRTLAELGRLMAQHSQPALGDDAPASRPAG